MCLYLGDLDVRVLGELRNQEVLVVFLGIDLSVEFQPGDGRLWTQVPVESLHDRRCYRLLSDRRSTPTVLTRGTFRM